MESRLRRYALRAGNMQYMSEQNNHTWQGQCCSELHGNTLKCYLELRRIARGRERLKLAIFSERPTAVNRIALMSKPDVLYHYCSTEAFKAIIDTKSVPAIAWHAVKRYC